jgi:hypothetical protein
MEAETVSEALDYNAILTRLIAREDFIVECSIFVKLVGMRILVI